MYFEHVFQTGSNYDVTVLTVSFPFPGAKFLFVVTLFLSAAPFSVVVSDMTGVELVFLTRSVSTCGDARCFRATLAPSPFASTTEGDDQQVVPNPNRHL